jgi:hypothetical protein
MPAAAGETPFADREFYHGTSTGRMAAITAGGLRDPFLADDYDLAMYYAEQAAEDDDSSPAVLRVWPDEAQLRYDGAAMDEPVAVTGTIAAAERRAAAALSAAARAHPEWRHGRYISVPPEAWQISFGAVGSCRAEGSVTRFERDDEDW